MRDERERKRKVRRGDKGEKFKDKKEESIQRDVKIMNTLIIKGEL